MLVVGPFHTHKETLEALPSGVFSWCPHFCYPDAVRYLSWYWITVVIIYFTPLHQAVGVLLVLGICATIALRVWRYRFVISRRR